MKPLRVFYIVAIVASLGLAFVFYYQYQLKDRELACYQSLSRSSNKALAKLNKELAESLNEREKLNTIIAALEKEKSGFKGNIQALKEERENLESKIARLIEEQTVSEKRFLLLTEKFHSLKELKKAIRMAKIEKRQRAKIERIQRRLVKIEMLKNLDEIALRQGNRGYLVKAGELTFKPTRIRVELEPVNKFSYKEIE